MIQLPILITNAGIRRTVLFFCLIITSELRAQMTNIRLGDSLEVSRLYMGVSSRLVVSTDSLDTSNDATFRAGAEVSLDLSKAFVLKALGVVQGNSNRPTGSIATFEFIGRFHPKLQMNVGLLPGPVTKLRPNPVSWQSQTELYAQSRLVGTKPGAVLKFNAAKKLFMSYGIFKQEGLWTSQARFKWDKLNFTGFYRKDKEYLMALDYTVGGFNMIVNYASEFDELALGAFVPLAPKWTTYLDVNYLLDEDQSSIGALGIRRHFDHTTTPLAGFFGLEYEFKSQTFFLQLIIHLNETQ